MHRKIIVGCILVIFFIFIFVQITNKDKNHKDKYIKLPAPTIVEKTPQEKAAEYTARAKKEKESNIERAKKEKESYVAQVTREIKSLDEWYSRDNPKLDTVIGVIMQTALMTAYAMIVNDSSKHQLSIDELNLVRTLKKKAISRQLKEFPRIRDEYGPVVRKKLWEVNMSAKTIGNKYTVIEYVGAVFANNANIKEFQGMVWETLLILRFKQSRYKWYKEDDEYTYYTINSPSDSQFGFWENQRFIEVDVKPQAQTQSQVQVQRDYQVTAEKSDGIVICQVTFLKVPSKSSDAAAIVRKAVEDLVKKDPSFEILAMAFNQGGEALADTKYGGPLVYKPTDKKILTMDERSGKKIVEIDEGIYFIKSEDKRTAKGITPVRRWVTLSIIFKSKPSNSEIRNIAEREIEKLKKRSLDINIYIYLGNKDNPGSWNQIQASNGNYMNVDYKVGTGKTKANWDWD